MDWHCRQRELRRAAKVCIHCGLVPVETFAGCDGCRERIREATRGTRDNRHAERKCIGCNNEPAGRYKYGPKCRLVMAAYQRGRKAHLHHA